ncbi:extradiol dioxygenase [Streptomyces sp. NBC_00424]|uniref:extradiol dioxygenase n=1 Tax=Streptomyces sp. NBC_00424 TaxID=2903648 RepID=UPI0022512A34|nr:extradiol dioxygenase [Streptomyces sp. NBC_00424]MCX5077645.1 extradiol dioxygenase [Streptomyces sp. NBC_00424]MCX5078548.1 extradiol dioxygenase [Streptomyces sp. NBC_00424]MCX5078894.1 extradiol dioxygenase [Streptomyces sp. NBC_00424]
MSTIQPMILTADQDVLLGSYTKLFGAEEIFRIPAEGPAFYLGLRIGDTDLGLVVALGGSVRGGPNDLPWGQRVAHIQDPDGNPVNLTQPISAR